jgi:hypothetical protein
MCVVEFEAAGRLGRRQDSNLVLITHGNILEDLSVVESNFVSLLG